MRQSNAIDAGAWGTKPMHAQSAFKLIRRNVSLSNTSASFIEYSALYWVTQSPLLMQKHRYRAHAV